MLMLMFDSPSVDFVFVVSMGDYVNVLKYGAVPVR